MNTVEEKARAEELLAKKNRGEVLTYKEWEFLNYSVYGLSRPCGSMIAHPLPFKMGTN